MNETEKSLLDEIHKQCNDLYDNFGYFREWWRNLESDLIELRARVNKYHKLINPVVPIGETSNDTEK